MPDSYSPSTSGSPALEDPGSLARRLMQRAHNRDGLPEIAIGAFLLLVSAIQLGLFYARQKPLLQVALGLAMVAAIVPGGLVMPQIIKWLRRRFLVAREGYFESRMSPAKRIGIGAGFAMGAAVAFSAMMAVKHGIVPPDRWLLAGTGFFAGVLTPLCGQSTRFVVEGLLMAAAGVAIGFSGVSLTAGFALLFGFMGAVSLVSGLAALKHFMRQTAESES